MRLGGWTRLWIVLSILLAVPSAFFAYATMPTRQDILASWYSEASEVLSRRLRGPEGEYFPAYQVKSAYFNGSESESLALLSKLERGTVERSKLSDVEIREVNARYRRRLDNLTEHQAWHWVAAVSAWLGFAFGIYATGWTMRWVYRGFRAGAS